MKADPNNVEEKELSKLINTTNKRVLDLGCGSGRLSFLLADKAKSFVGIDMNKERIEKAIKNIPPNLKNKIKFLHQKVEKLDFKDESFDVVFMALTLHEITLSKQAQVLKEIYRVLTKDGSLYIVESLPNGEVQEIFSTAYEIIRSEDHAARINYSKALLESFDSEGWFKLMDHKRYDCPWIFENKEDLFKFIVAEEHITENLARKYKEEISKKLLLDNTPLIINDQVNFFEYRKIPNENLKLTRLPRIPDWVTDEHDKKCQFP